MEENDYNSQYHSTNSLLRILIVPAHSSSSLRQLSVADLQGFGERFGIDFQFPRLAAGAGSANPVVSRGRVDELTLASGLHLTHSSLDILQPYESLSTRNTSFFLLAIMEGSVAISIAGQQHIVPAGMALTTRLAVGSRLRAAHRCNQHLKTLTLALDSVRTSGDMPLPWSPDSFPHLPEPITRLWRIPPHLHQALRQLHTWQRMNALQRRLLLEGLALQLLAHGIGDSAEPARTAALSPDERGRLEKVRLQIDGAPGLDYAVSQLAGLAAMSPSSFRGKFRQMFGMPVFDYLRDRRLALARQYLQQGYSVQQAAHLSGYRHATNFATAFRKHYGATPSSLN
ncbi:helix-turn-helix transcriptional regulator [uncultured Castellaniella sp.]|uniref:helix-turn-helix transcriptional regulator n=1 Tax=uncultured Castellaniella sp. TaxID=647907 RepID=UPI0026097BEF|nr:helix-turn-helix transcriptional regulator [uncultured Castellaniella sp.]